MRTVKLANLGNLVRDLPKAQVAAAVTAIRLTVATVGVRLVQEAISAANPPPVDRGTYRRNWRTANVPGGARIYNPSAHASVIEDGRRAGARMPPPAVIGEWARRKGLLKGVKKAERASAQKAIGFVIARAIARRGLKARKILAGTFDKLIDEVREAAHAAIMKIA